MVEQELVIALQEITDQFIEEVKAARKTFITEAEEAAIIGDSDFKFEGACQRCAQKIRRAVSAMKEDDHYTLSSFGLMK